MKKSEKCAIDEQKFRAGFDELDEEGQQLLLNSMNRMLIMRVVDCPEAKALDKEFCARLLSGERVSREEFKAHDAKMNALLGIA